MPDPIPGPMRQLRRGLAAGAALLLAACAGLSPGDPWPLYERALADAAVATPAKALALRPIPQQPTVEVVSWVVGDRRPCEGPACRFIVGDSRMWVTLAGEVQETCRNWKLQGDALRVRLEQLLGLPPNTPERWRKTHVLTLEVPRQALDRPCFGELNDAQGLPRCTLRPSPHADPALTQFVSSQMASVWVHGEPQGPGYPFTRLGYTYDWYPGAASRGRYGASEFVIKPRTQVVVRAEAATDSYCRPVDGPR
jgi:hypothetical protein